MIKEQVYRKCLDILNARIDKYKGELEIIKESIENNDKASSDEEGGGTTDFTSAQNKVVQYLEEANQMKINSNKLIFSKPMRWLKLEVSLKLQWEISSYRFL